MKKAVALSALILCGCQAQPAAIAYTPNCNLNQTEFPTQKDFALKLWECGDKAEAKKVAKSEADNGSAEMADIFLQILASDRETELGLAYALKYAEQGDEPASRWALRIARDQEINSLTQQINAFYTNIFSSNPKYPYLYLEEYVLFSAKSLARENNDTDKYSKKFFSLSKERLSKEEIRRIEILLLEVDAEKDRWRNS